MSRDLVQRNFRYVNGMVARDQLVSVVYRGTGALAPLFAGETGPESVPNPFRTDNNGVFLLICFLGYIIPHTFRVFKFFKKNFFILSEKCHTNAY